MPPEYKKEWLDRSKIDYFSCFVSLWLSCNSWYLSHYSDLELDGAKRPPSEREYINRIKSDTTNRNHLFKCFKRLMVDEGKAGMSFRADLEMLKYALDHVEIKPDWGRVSFENVRIQVKGTNQDVSLLKTPRKLKSGKVSKKEIGQVIKLDNLFLKNDLPDCFAGIFEIIYQVRNALVHGKLNPEKDEHDLVKYCYRVLYELMASF